MASCNLGSKPLLCLHCYPRGTKEAAYQSENAKQGVIQFTLWNQKNLPLSRYNSIYAYKYEYEYTTQNNDFQNVAVCMEC